MRGLLLLALAFLTPGVASATLPPLPSDPKAPVKLVSFAPPPANVACAGGPARLIESAPLPPKVWQIWIPPVGSMPYTPPAVPTTEVYGFSIDADGHVTDLRRKTLSNGPGIWNTDEQAAILASWRFAPGAAAKDCQVDLSPSYLPLAEASPARLFEALANEPRNAPQPLRQALSVNGDCGGASRRRPQAIVYPDTRPFDDKTIDPAWAGLLFDIDAGGATRNVRVVAQHGQPAFADAAASAIAEGRYFPGPPRTGCYVAFQAIPKATDAPKRPGPPSDPSQDDCKITKAELNLPENKFFPPAFGKRRVSGRALLKFDVAPWGQIGAIEVLESQPTAAFGEAGRILLNGSRPKPPPTGYRGCVVPILFAIPAMPEEDY